MKEWGWIRDAVSLSFSSQICLGLVLLVKTILLLIKAWSSATIWTAWSHANISQTRTNQTSKHCLYLSLSIHFIIQVNDVILLCSKISLFYAALRGVLWSCVKETVTWDFMGFLWLEWIYLGLNGNCLWFFSFKEIPFILDSQFKYWCISYQTFSEIRRISKTDWELSPRFFNFPFFWVSSPPRNAAKGVDTFWRFVESLRMIDN
jgi:hypothetical protein